MELTVIIGRAVATAAVDTFVTVVTVAHSCPQRTLWVLSWNNTLKSLEKLCYKVICMAMWESRGGVGITGYFNRQQMSTTQDRYKKNTTIIF